MVVSALQNRGYQIVTAGDGEEAIEKASRELPRLAILDIIMPKKNGFQVLRHIRTTPETKEMKVLLLSSKNQESDKFWGLKQGADAYMTKPFEDDVLLETVVKLM
jgi:twitching motility two-component system response regulator PilH